VLSPSEHGGLLTWLKHTRGKTVLTQQRKLSLAVRGVPDDRCAYSAATTAKRSLLGRTTDASSFYHTPREVHLLTNSNAYSDR
jgi:hypothetical protein